MHVDERGWRPGFHQCSTYTWIDEQPETTRNWMKENVWNNPNLTNKFVRPVVLFLGQICDDIPQLSPNASSMQFSQYDCKNPTRSCSADDDSHLDGCESGTGRSSYRLSQSLISWPVDGFELSLIPTGPFSKIPHRSSQAIGFSTFRTAWRTV